MALVLDWPSPFTKLDRFTVFAGCRNDLCDGALLALKKLGDETGRLHVLQMDVTNQEEVDAALVYVECNLPELGLWGLVNNAGFVNLGFAEWLPVENYKKVRYILFEIMGIDYF